MIARGSQQACAALFLDRVNELARDCCENRAEIDNLRWQLSAVREAVQR